MSKIKLTGESSGYVEISAGSNAGNNTLELPTSGTRLVASDSDGNVTIGGTLTYADVTNVDSVGVITARSGLNVTGGNVGIGTDNPTEDLEIVSDSITSAQITSLGDDSATRTTRLNFNFSDGGGAAIAAKRAVGVANTETYLSIRTGGATNNDEKIRIESNGNVGIGTDSPSAPISIKVGPDGEYVQDFRGTADKQFGFFYDQHSWNQATFRIDEFDSNGTATSRLTITDGGKIGIGNTLPLYAMHFKNEMSATPSYIHMQVTGTNTVGGGGGIAFDTSASNNASNNGLYLATIRGERNSADNGSNDLVFSTSKASVAGDDGNNHTPAEKLRIGTRGELGLSGANYGTAGQVIKSNGSGASPAWSDLYSRYFYGEQDAQQGSWPNATYKKLQNLGGRAINIGPSSIATWDESGGNLTIGADGAGYWFLSMSGGIDDIQNADFVQVVIGKNGGTTSVGTRISSYSRAYPSSTNQITDAQVSCIANLSAGDVVRFYLYHQEGTADEHSEPSRCFAMGYKI